MENNTTTVQKRKSQNAIILEHIQNGNKIDPEKAGVMCRCKRLAARVGELRERGFNIKTEMISYIDKDGVKIKYGEYSLISQNEA